MANVPISAFTVGANTTGIGASGYSLTGSAANSYIDLAGTWNTSGTPTAIKLNITDTASNASSLLMDLQVGGSTRFRVTKTGILSRGGTSYIDFNANSADRLRLVSNTASGGVYFNGLDAHFPQSGFIGWDASGSPGSGACDVSLFRDAAQTLAQRNSTNAQTFRVYNTFTDASNYERGKIEWASNVLRIGTEKAGTGTARALELQTDGTTRITINTDAATSTLSADGFMVLSGNIGANNHVWLRGISSGVLRLTNTAANDFNRLQFGGVTASFPSLKRSTTSLQARLADDSDFTNIQGKLTTETAYAAGAPTATGYLVLYDSTGAAYKVPAVAV